MVFIYCVVVAIVMEIKFVQPFTSGGLEEAAFLAIGAGFGSVFGLICTVWVHCIVKFSDGIGCSIIAMLVLLPLIMFIIGLILVLVFGSVFLIQPEHGDEVVGSGVILFALIAGICRGGGSILIVLFYD